MVSKLNLSKRTVYFNDDSNILMWLPHPFKPEWLANYIRIFAAHGIDIFAWDTALNGVCWYGGSKAGPGVSEGRSEFFDFEPLLVANNIRHLTQAGYNPPALVARECHRYGMLIDRRV